MDHCLDHTGTCEKISVLEKELPKLQTTLEHHGERLTAIETDRKVERASLSRTDRLLVIVIPPLATLAGILLLHYLQSPVGAAVLSGSQ